MTTLPRADRELIKEKGIIPKLRLGNKTEKGVSPTGPKRVTFVAVKFIEGTDQRTGKPTEYARYLFEENGEKKTYQTKKFNEAGEVHYLVQRLAEVNEGDEIIMEMKKRGMKNYISVVPVNQSSEVEVGEVDEEEVIE